jgi:predicted RNA-binding protein with PUA-like domain
VNLAQIKADEKLADLALVKHTRLSVMPVEPTHYELILSKSI